MEHCHFRCHIQSGSCFSVWDPIGEGDLRFSDRLIFADGSRVEFLRYEILLGKSSHSSSLTTHYIPVVQTLKHVIGQCESNNRLSLDVSFLHAGKGSG